MEALAATLSCFLVLLVLVNSQDPCYFQEECPDIQPMTHIDLKQYSGIWIENYQTDELDYQCPIFDLLYTDGSPPKMKLLTMAKRMNGTPFNSSSGMVVGKTCTILDADYIIYQKGSGVIFPNDLKIFVLESDYETYTVEYGCTMVDGKKQEMFGAASREGVPSITLEKVKEVLTRNGIDTSIIRSSRMISCD